MQGLLRSYFGEMRATIERHGGTVEKFIGDAVVAAFGVPEAHEDDALRACRAALEMQERMVPLNVDLERRFGTSIAIRVGVNTGEVLADPDTMVTGDPVNVAARLEQAAEPGEVLLGELTYRLVRDVVRVEAMEPLAAKGKAEPVLGYRLLEIDQRGALTRRAVAPLAGRTDELDLLERELETALAEKTCRLVTVEGEPGVGKSRLLAEFAARIEMRARVVRGSCLSYGEGITYWAVGQIVRELSGIRDDHSREQALALIEAHARGVPNGKVVAAKIAQLLGFAEGDATAPETAWAIRHFLIAQAGKVPLVVLVDDIQWAEPALLDLVAGLPGAIADASLLIVCLARPELLEHRPEWQVALLLEPLGRADLDTLLASLLGDTDTGVRARLAQASAGNPLFAEELVAMLLDEGVLRVESGVCALTGDLETVTLPATLQTLLAARLDRLDRGARDTLERGAIEGEVFHRGAVVELSHPDARLSVTADLEALAEKGFVRPAAASFAGEAAFRFKHILVREATYQATAKKLRAVLHESFAGWLEQLAGERIYEYEEILGYHLEHSYRYRTELGPADEETRALGVRAAHRLASSGRRAFARGDLGAATNLLSRASALLPSDSRERIELVPDLVESLFQGARIEEAEALLEDAVEAVERLGDDRLSALVNVHRAKLMFTIDPGWLARALAEAERAVPVFESLGDDLALTRAWGVISEVNHARGHGSAAGMAAERGLFHAERAGDKRHQGKHRTRRTALAHSGFVPLKEVEEALKSDLDWAQEAGDLWPEAIALLTLGLVRRARGDPVKGNELLSRGNSILADLGMGFFVAGYTGSWIWWLTDDPVVAEAQLRQSYETLAEAGERAVLSTVAANLAEALYRQERYDEAEDMCSACATAADADDVVTQTLVRTARAKILARRRMPAKADAVAREAVALAGETDFVDLRGDSLLALGEVLRLTGRPDEAADTMRDALALWEAKENVVFASRTRRLLAELGAPVPARPST